MNLQQFVSETLKQITEGVKQAQSDVVNGAEINPKIWNASRENAAKMKIFESNCGKWIHMINFDVAVSVDSSTETKSGIGLFVGPVALGSQGKSNADNSSISRIKFQIPISFPEKNE